MLNLPSPTTIQTEIPEKRWVSPSEGIAHAPDPNDPSRRVEGGFRFGGVIFDGLDWLNGPRGPCAPQTKEVK